MIQEFSISGSGKQKNMQQGTSELFKSLLSDALCSVHKEIQGNTPVVRTISKHKKHCTLPSMFVSCIIQLNSEAT